MLLTPGPLRFLTTAALLLAATPSALPVGVDAATARHGRHASAYRIKASVGLPGYGDPRPVALGPSGSIAGDGDLNGSRRCLLYSGGTTVDITPAGWDFCSVAAMSNNGTVVGRVAHGSTGQGFIYRAGRDYVIPGAASFSAINAASLVLGVKQDGNRGAYDPQTGNWTTFSDASRGCALGQPLALNDRFVFGSASCSDASVQYAFAAPGHFAPVALPFGLQPTSLLTGADQLVLSDPRSGGHAYLWSAGGTRPALDLGEAPGDLYGTYTPIAANSQGVVIGANYPQFFSWVRTPADGMRELDGLIVPRIYFGISLADVDENGNILARAFDFTSGSQVWLVLQPV